MNWIKEFEESILCKKENDKIFAMAVGKLGCIIDDSHTLPKWEIKQVYDVLFRSIVARGRIDIIQNKLAKELLKSPQHNSESVNKK